MVFKHFFATSLLTLNNVKIAKSGHTDVCEITVFSGSRFFPFLGTFHLLGDRGFVSGCVVIDCVKEVEDGQREADQDPASVPEKHSPEEPVGNREMEYKERASYSTFYPFQNKHQIHRHLPSVQMLCAIKNQNLVSHEEVRRLTRHEQISITDERSRYSISLVGKCAVSLNLVKAGSTN